MYDPQAPAFINGDNAAPVPAFNIVHRPLTPEQRRQHILTVAQRLCEAEIEGKPLEEAVWDAIRAQAEPILESKDDEWSDLCAVADDLSDDCDPNLARKAVLDVVAAVNALPEHLARIAELDAALAFYADPANHIGYPDPSAKVYIETSAIDRDGGDRARAALSGGKP
jgi:hypothetical protein